MRARVSLSSLVCRHPTPAECIRAQFASDLTASRLRRDEEIFDDGGNSINRSAACHYSVTQFLVAAPRATLVLLKSAGCESDCDN